MALRLRLGAAGLLAASLAGCGSSGPPKFTVANATSDIKITSCTVNGGGRAVADFKVTNHSSYPADYVTTIDIMAGGRAIPSVPGIDGGVGAGKSVVGQATGTTAVASGTKITCAVSAVRRTPSNVIPTK